jgi:hypothetical protein
MVRRGSTVRVRQRALQKPRITGLLFRIDLQILERGAGMEPFMEPSGRKRGPGEPRCPTLRRQWRLGAPQLLSTKPKAKLASPSMVLDGIRRLAVADLDETALERLAAHGEDLFVERKRAIPNDGIGRTVAAFANSLGGWLLLGVANDGTPVGFSPPGRADPQAYIGQLLAAEVDPLPPYLAAARQIKGIPILVVRVFESADTPHLLRATGALVLRTTRGTETVADQRLLLELARRGEEALLRAMSTRIGSDLITRELATPDHPRDMAVDDAGVAVVVHAAFHARFVPEKISAHVRRNALRHSQRKPSATSVRQCALGSVRVS